jgi:hypothetical protein
MKYFDDLNSPFAPTFVWVNFDDGSSPLFIINEGGLA